ncbi:hypothetical protein J7I98_23770 [Streptomyces sp. ISL-98]|uniref:hypothetical protein n=1 Tax=Streptomyces sp. ISL-98 TaxID=2819192 RepID=UPI001BE9D596|nr:hypothetical protein [Streptomyces sp. ISL-98]MBT2508849.1 hypothetical protein [Streptomyces sp. ISL-98]
MYPTLFTTPGVKQFAEEIDAERQRQLAKFGDQRHRDGTHPDRIWAFTGPAGYVANCARENTDQLASEGHVTWLDIALEEFAEAAAESDPAKLRTELIQVAAVCAAWVSDLDRRANPGEHPSATEAESDEQRADRLETERNHAAGGHQYCGVSCEVEFPSEMLRNGILARAVPGSAGMLDELVRRAAQPAAMVVCICGHPAQRHFEDNCLACDCGDYLEPEAAREVIARWREAATRLRAEQPADTATPVVQEWALVCGLGRGEWTLIDTYTAAERPQAEAALAHRRRNFPALEYSLVEAAPFVVGGEQL